jgi:hypothetical protein
MRAQDAIDRPDRAEQQARAQRAELEQGRAQAALDAERRQQRERFEQDSAAAQKRLGTAEKLVMPRSGP